MRIEILSIGNELVLGQTADANAPWLAQRLAGIGAQPRRFVVVADELPVIVEALRSAAERSDVVLITGGLGPTPDDLTRQALADAISAPLELHDPSLRRIAEFFRRRNRPMADSNRVQAMIPRGAQAIDNLAGTAPGMQARLHQADVFVMPGVPSEMRAMFERAVLPPLAARCDGAAIVQRRLHTFGVSEAVIGEKLAELMRADRNPHVGTSADELVITIRVNARGASRGDADRLAEADLADIRERLGEAVFGQDGETLQDAVGRQLSQMRRTVATAESCTGGLLAKRLTDVPGSSGYFLQGWVTYANAAKTSQLGVPAELIARQGAVSAAVAESMAAGCRTRAGVDYALSITGIAGPAGGTAEKPVGMVFVGLAGPAGAESKELRLGEALLRKQVRDRAVKAALNMLRAELETR